MRVDPTSHSARAGRTVLDRPATVRDPSRGPVDVLVRDLSATGALLETDGDLPTGTLVSLGIAGAGMQFARVARQAPGGAAVEFLVPLEAAALAAAGRADTLVSVAFPQVSSPPSRDTTLGGNRFTAGLAAETLLVTAPDPDSDHAAGGQFTRTLLAVLSIVILVLWLAS